MFVDVSEMFRHFYRNHRTERRTRMNAGDMIRSRLNSWRNINDRGVEEGSNLFEKSTTPTTSECVG